MKSVICWGWIIALSVGEPEERPTMYPYNTASAPREERSLEADDLAG